MNIVRAFIEGLSCCQRHLLSTFQLYHDGALQHVNKRMCILSVDSARPAGRSSTVIIRASLPGFSGRSLDMRDVTLGSRATAVPVMRHSRTNATSLIVIFASFVRARALVTAGEIPGRTSGAGSGCCL
jgi:hypothetical protein